MTVMADNPSGVPRTAKNLDVLNDNALAVRFARGDRAAFEQLVAAYQPLVTRVVYRLLAWPDDVDDVVQEVFLAALKSMKRFRGDSRLSTWLTRIAINKCRSHRRKCLTRLKHTRPGKVEDRDLGTGSADADGMRREVFLRVRQAVARLPAKCREVIVLRYLEEMSTAEVAEALGVSRRAVDVRLHRARKRLEAMLQGQLET